MGGAYVPSSSPITEPMPQEHTPVGVSFGHRCSPTNPPIPATRRGGSRTARCLASRSRTTPTTELFPLQSGQLFLLHRLLSGAEGRIWNRRASRPASSPLGCCPYLPQQGQPPPPMGPGSMRNDLFMEAVISRFSVESLLINSFTFSMNFFRSSSLNFVKPRNTSSTFVIITPLLVFIYHRFRNLWFVLSF